MKIIRLSTFLDYGGIESKMANLSRLEDQENTWMFCALGRGGTAEQSIKANGKKVVCLNKGHKIPNFKTIAALILLLRRERPDVVHASGAEANFHGLIAARLVGVKKILVEEIGIPNQSKMAKAVFSIIYKFADLVIGESRIVSDKLKEMYPIEGQKLKVVPNFCLPANVTLMRDVENVCRLPMPRDTFHIVCVSRLEPVKNLEALIRVLARIKQENVSFKLTIVGDGSMMQVLKSLVATLSLDREVSFVGYVKDPSPYLLAADLYVLNSITEGFSNSLLEAMHLGVPCLSTRVGAAPEIIREWFNGWLTDVDEEKLFNKLKSIIELDPPTRERIGKNGIETVVHNYSLKKHTQLLMQLYTS